MNRFDVIRSFIYEERRVDDSFIPVHHNIALLFGYVPRDFGWTVRGFIEEPIFNPKGYAEYFLNE